MPNHVTTAPFSPNPPRANEEIAQVRTKAKAESAALHAGLRKEQMKVESLERALQQKVTLPPASMGCAGLLWASVVLFGCLGVLWCWAVCCCRSLCHEYRGEFGHQERCRHGGPQGLLLFQNQEIEELTKICDELIAKLGRTD